MHGFDPAVSCALRHYAACLAITPLHHTTSSAAVALQSGRKLASTKRKTSRRRQDSSCSEDEEEEEEEELFDDEDDLDEGADEQGASCHAHSGSASGSQAYEQDQQQDYAAAVAAAAAAAGYGYGAAELQQPWVASLAAGIIHGALASAVDPAAHAAAQHFDEQQPQEQQQSEASIGAEADGEDDDEDDAADHDAAIRHRGSAQPAAPIGRFKSLPSKLGGAGRAAAGGRALKHTGSMPVNRPVPSSSCMSPGALWSAQQSLNGSLNWSPGRLLLSPQRPMGRGRGAAAVDVGKDVNEEEAAGEHHHPLA